MIFLRSAAVSVVALFGLFTGSFMEKKKQSPGIDNSCFVDRLSQYELKSYISDQNGQPVYDKVRYSIVLAATPSDLKELMEIDSTGKSTYYSKRSSTQFLHQRRLRCLENDLLPAEETDPRVAFYACSADKSLVDALWKEFKQSYFQNRTSESQAVD